ncbi:MAG: hypothetical protein WCD66_05120 [Rhodanobacteraceae bacterium]
MYIARRVLSLSLLLMTFSVAAAQPPAPSYSQNGFNPRMLDTSIPASERLNQFANMMTLANKGQVRAQDLAGTLLWQGSRVEGSPLKRNLGQARKLLANAAVHGEVIAMAKLAELELAAGRTEQAMVWAQMYARYQNPMAMQRARRGRSAAYGSDLIQRISKAGGTINKGIRTDVAAMVSRFDEPIRRGIDAFSSVRRGGDAFLVRGPAGTDKVEYRNINGMAEYLVAFDASGAPGMIWLLDSLPDAKTDTMVRHYLERARANSVDKDSGTRYLKVTIVHNALKARVLRPVH